ncbi:hypothetical protein [Rhodococcus sp. 1168]|uniref:Rv0361 family membrane protein n=1 Tax=Rhodococcus sp. 1168 TaxID=2018041 RepID=UPI000A0990AB|nr:hypothetical protein [Rhodococcus sp. 1168]ORI19237.1 hypothetical protein BJI47_12190 [Rhodococcus sp. 1168]
MSDPQDKSNEVGEEPATEAIRKQEPPAAKQPLTTKSLPPAAPDPAEAETTALTKVPPTTEQTHPAPSTVKPSGATPTSRPPVAPRRIPARGELSQPQARPQRIEPTRSTSTWTSGSRRWILAIAGALVLIIAIGVTGFAYLSRDDEGSSADAQIRMSIQSFTQALSTGDLATLRSASCGELAAFYRDIPDADFADVHRIAVEQGNVPVVESIDAVQVTGDAAIAQVLAHTAANPADTSPRTFDLRRDGDVWKVCSPSSPAPPE